MSWVFAGMLDDIPLRGARVLRIADESIGVFRTSGNKVYALRDSCPHKAGPLSQGIVHGQCVTCPLHDWVIDLTTGQATGPDEGATRTYPVSVRDGRVLVDVSLVAEVPEETVELAKAAQ